MNLYPLHVYCFSHPPDTGGICIQSTIDYLFASENEKALSKAIDVYHSIMDPLKLPVTSNYLKEVRDDLI